MSKLIESIASGDFVSANKLFEQRIEQIAEKKLYETKRMMQTEVVKPVKGKPGEFTGQNTPADWAKYRKAHPALGMYDTPSSKGKKPEGKVAKQRESGYVKAADVLGDPSRHRMKPLVKLKKKIVKTVKEDALDEIKLPGEVAGSFGRNVAARLIKTGRKYLGKDFATSYMKARRDSASAPSPEPEPSQDSGTEPKKKKATGIVGALKAASDSFASQYGS